MSTPHQVSCGREQDCGAAGCATHSYAAARQAVLHACKLCGEDLRRMIRPHLERCEANAYRTHAAGCVELACTGCRKGNL